MFRTSRPFNFFSKTNKNQQHLSASSSSCRQEEAIQKKSSLGLAQHHPNVKLPSQYHEKSREDQIQQCCHRLQKHPNAVDTLYKTLLKIKANPMEPKYRIIDTAHPGYQRSLANVPGIEPLLQAIYFVPSGKKNQLLLSHLDQNLIQFALKCLEEVRQSAEYIQSKKEMQFRKEMNALLRTVPSDSELRERNVLLSKLPKEAMEGSGTLIQIKIPLLNNDNTETSETLQRHFDSDDTIQDVVNWLGGTLGTMFVANLTINRRWSLVDRNRMTTGNESNCIPVDCSGSSGNRTLQYHGLWPSGKLVLCPSSPAWRENDPSLQVDIGGSRGLASGV